MTRLTVELPDDVAQRFALLAASRGRDTGDMAVEALRSFVAHYAERREQDALQDLSDDDIIAMADLRLTPKDDARLAELLELNGEGALTDEQAAELNDMMRTHDDALLRKSMGWAEAVRRKLRQPMSP